VRRNEPGAFSDQQVSLLETFADQAVIAIENARLFEELEERNTALREALDQQTATSDVLRVIASSPTDLQTVLETIAESAARLCGAGNAVIGRVDGDLVRNAAKFGETPEGALEPELGQTWPLSRGHTLGRAIVDRAVVHVHDRSRSTEDFSDLREFIPQPSPRTSLAVPLLRHDTAIGAILVRRSHVEPYSDDEIELLKTFADQAVIAIENTRLFEELEERNRDLLESLQQEEATAEILRILAGSPTDLSSVLSAVAERATRLCGAHDAIIWRPQDDSLRTAAVCGTLALKVAEARGVLPISRTTGAGRAYVDGTIVHVPDMEGAVELDFPDSLVSVQAGQRAGLNAPLLRDGVAIGVISVGRTESTPFTNRQIALLERFADQAVIAIENSRLFGELEERTRDLARSVQQLQALGEVSQAVSSTLDLQHVLTTVLTHAVQLSGMDGGSIFEFEADARIFSERATQGLGGEMSELLRVMPLRAGEGLLGRAAELRQPMQVADILEEGAYQGPMRLALIQAGYRAMLAVPLVREDEVIGGLIVRRGSPGEVAEETVTLLQTFATQSALAIQNARLFNELDEKSRQLAIASQHKSQFLANMSHELRTPLNAILGYTELIMDEIYGQVPPKIAETLERVQTSGRHLLALINDVLDLSKMEAGQLILAPQEYALADVIQTVYTAVESLASEKGIGLRTEVAPDLPMGYGDDRRLVQVILNLVGNAIKFTDRGEVVIGCSASGGSAISRQPSAISDQPTSNSRLPIADSRLPIADSRFLVTVRDTGPGISPEQQVRIFEEFQQADTSSTREKGGTGLGLSIARRIVELHGGRIWVESEEGQGSTFAFEIPVRSA
jgi:signal transduction histidine kinase